MKLRFGDEETLVGRATRALGWSFFNTALARFGTMGIGIFLARLLGPHAFGTFAVAFVAMVALLSFNDLGVSLAIVRWPGDPREIAPTVATVSVLSSLILYVGCFFGAPAFSHAMGAPAAAPVIRVLALNVVISGVVAVPAELLQRYFRQDRKMIADQVNNWVGAGVSVGLACAGFGAMSLGIGQLAGGLAAGVLFVTFSPVPLRFGFDVAKARALLRFGLPMAGSSAIVFLVANVDNFVVGHILGATDLGWYVLAWNLASWPVNMFSLPVRGVAPALFSRLQHDPPVMRRTFLSAVSLLGSVTLPVCLVISGSAVPLLDFVYGARWEPAARALVWLGLLAALRILFELAYDYFVVLARSSVVLTVEVLWLLALIPSLIAGARADGIFGVGVADVAVATCVVVPWYLRELSKVGIRRRDICARLWLPLIAAASAGAVAAVAAHELHSDLAALAVGGVVGLIAIGFLLYKCRKVIAELRTATALGRSDSGLPRDSELPHPAIDDAASPPQAASDSSDAGAVPESGPTHSASADEMPLMMVTYNDVTDMTGQLPLYQETVASQCWDPARTIHRGRPPRKPATTGTHGPWARPSPADGDWLLACHQQERHDM